MHSGLCEGVNIHGQSIPSHFPTFFHRLNVSLLTILLCTFLSVFQRFFSKTFFFLFFFFYVFDCFFHHFFFKYFPAVFATSSEDFFFLIARYSGTSARLLVVVGLHGQYRDLLCDGFGRGDEGIRQGQLHRGQGLGVPRGSVGCCPYCARRRGPHVLPGAQVGFGYGVVWYCTVWCGMVWYCVVLYGMV